MAKYSIEGGTGKSPFELTPPENRPPVPAPPCGGKWNTTHTVYGPCAEEREESQSFEPYYSSSFVSQVEGPVEWIEQPGWRLSLNCDRGHGHTFVLEGDAWKHERESDYSDWEMMVNEDSSFTFALKDKR